MYRGQSSRPTYELFEHTGLAPVSWTGSSRVHKVLRTFTGRVLQKLTPRMVKKLIQLLLSEKLKFFNADEFIEGATLLRFSLIEKKGKEGGVVS